MRSAVLSFVLVACLSVPALAQPTTSAARTPAVSPSVRLAPGSLFNAQTLRIGHQVEMSYSGGAGGALGMGMYTSSVQWQPSARLAGRVDVGVAQPMFASGALASSLGAGATEPRVFLRNAEIAWRPTESATLHLSVQQSPYGAYASPYGVGAPYSLHAPYGLTRASTRWATEGTDRLFFRDAGDGR